MDDATCRESPLSLVRCPTGNNKKCFFQKQPGTGKFELLEQFRVQEKRRTAEYLTLDSLAGLISLAQMGVLEIHIWGCRTDELEKPDRLTLDLDPGATVSWSEVVVAAHEVRDLLESLDLVAFLKTTGGKGLHVVIPIRRRHSWNKAKDFCHEVANALVRVNPERYVAQMSKASRRGKIFVDYLRNARGATSIIPFQPRQVWIQAPHGSQNNDLRRYFAITSLRCRSPSNISTGCYSTRAKPGAPVSVPIA